MDSRNLTSASPIRVLVVDDHPAIRQGLAFLLAPEGVEVCAEAGGRDEALRQVREHRPGLAIVDLSLEGEDGTGLIADLHALGVPVLVYSMHNDARRVRGAFAAGALGYVTKREFRGVLVQAVHEVACGRPFASPMAAAALAESATASGTDDGTGKLSAHEQKVYELLGHGEGTYEIAAALHVSNHTVESYYERIKVKMGLKGMYELRRHAIDDLQKHRP